MKKKRGMNIVGYGTKVAVGGIGLGMIEQVGGTGTHMGADYIGGMSKAINPMANIQGTKMVLGSLKQIKMPKLKGGKKKMKVWNKYAYLKKTPTNLLLKDARGIRRGVNYYGGKAMKLAIHKEINRRKKMGLISKRAVGIKLKRRNNNPFNLGW